MKVYDKPNYQLHTLMGYNLGRVPHTNLELDVFLPQRTRLLLQSLDLLHRALQVHVADVTTHLERGK